MFGLSAKGISAELQELPLDSLFTADSEGYWNRLRNDQFLMPNVRVFLKTGSLGVTPRSVLNAVATYMEKAAKLHVEDLQIERYPRWGYETLDAERSAISEFVGCSRDELAITHNATEAMSIIVGGMPLSQGSEVLMTDQEHPSGRDPWKVREAKGELKTRVVKLPLPPKSSE